MDYGETLDTAALREAKEKTCLEVKLIRQFHVYSDPNQDYQQHNISIVFLARIDGVPKLRYSCSKGLHSQSTKSRVLDKIVSKLF